MTTVLVRENPRTLVIKPASNIAKNSIILASDTQSKCIVSFSDQDMIGYKLLAPRPIHGCIGIVTIENESFVGIITEASRIADFEGHDVMNVIKVMFYCISSSKYDRLAVEVNETSATRLENQQPQIIHPCSNLMKLLSSGSFYFSHTFDLTRDMRSRISESRPVLMDGLNMDFVWNKSIISELLRIKRQDVTPSQEIDLNSSRLLVPLMQGFVGIQNININNSKWQMGIISRLSSNRAGTRFNARGIDDDGHVSNFVETEFLIYCGHSRVSFLQLRGSIPLFWEQTGLQVSHKVKISRGLESTLHATKKHFENLIKTYSNIQVLNLLSQSPASPEYDLNITYKSAVNQLKEFQSLIRYHEFDFHAIVGRDQYDRLDSLARAIRPTMSDFGFSLYDSSLDVIVQQQYGIVRTNCLDCLDRTNVVQTLVGKEFLKTWFAQLGIRLHGFEETNMDDAFNNLWADNGDWLSKIYAGTGALKSSYTRKGKQTVFGFLDDAAKSVNRFYVQNFQDKSRQEAIDLLLTNEPNLKTHGKHNISEELDARISQYSSNSNLILFCGTYNFNGKLPQNESLESWLTSQQVGIADIAVIGCQELIQLTPGEYITADTDKLRLIWEDTLLKALNSFTSSDYVLLRSLHLVALGMFVFVRKGMTTRIREAEACSIKTGLMGMAANKGGIGFRMKVDDTSLAFITAHFAAGQNMTDDRNRDYWTITDGLVFKGGIKCLDHDLVFWFGDFNYRINGENAFVRSMVAKKEYPKLWAKDQLLTQLGLKTVFVGFQEGPLIFDPTYKYDNNSLNYDTSEKQRVPAYTDRILFKGNNVNLIEYNRGEQKMSDHRPVKAFFRIPIVQYDKNRKKQIETELRGLSNNSPTIPSNYLPPPSTDQVKWWETQSSKEIPITNGGNPFFDFETGETLIGSTASINSWSTKPVVSAPKHPFNLMD